MENEKLSVAFLYDDSLDRADGVSQQVRRLGEWMAMQGHTVNYLVGDTKLDAWAGGKVHSLSKNIKVVFNGNRLTIPLVSHKRQIKQTLRQINPDVIHVQMPYSPLMAARVIGASNKNVAIVGTFHILPSGWLSNFGSYLLHLWLWPNLRRLDRVIAVSQPAAVFAWSAYGVDSTVIPNMVDSAALKPTEQVAKSGHRVVFLGRLVERKGCRQLIEAFGLLAKDTPQAELVIAGDGPQRKSLEALAGKLSIADRVKFLGYIDEKDKPNLLASADIACFPSLGGESFGVVLIEAMAAGARVVLGGDNPGYRSVLSERPDLLINPQKTKEFADKLRIFLTDADKAEATAEWQSQTVGQYDVNAVGRRVFEIYLDAIAKRTKAGA